MGKYVSTAPRGLSSFSVIDRSAFKKLLNITDQISFSKIIFEEKIKKTETFYDTPNNMLNRAGIILSRITVAGKSSFKVARQSFLPKAFRSSEDVYFLHEVGTKDKITDHSLYLIDGITTIIGTSFSIDLENVLKSIIPNMEVKTISHRYKFISGTGFRCFIDLNSGYIENFQTHRTNECETVDIIMDCPAIYQSQYDEFVLKVEKYIKALTPIKDSQYDYAVRVTKKLESASTPQKKGKGEK